ncbi:hypothetical protein FK529_04675 [Tsukamurella asaccharolytica]|uniref:Uncharacterized protein n=1 Tax=Tsukamurella asaccharolytica TaxID=2592067 RepID=A0A5C5REW8_9ACTN|nr:hypothetical protein [Tsukamurella asaccharolytica]TWS20641.1 hypothetical protein FK529_04675 [Tsukamurella asaccharolytica]
MNIRIKSLTQRPDNRGDVTVTVAIRNHRLTLSLNGVGRVELDRAGALQLAHFIADEGGQLR